jgi:glucosamine 6-phosphate synthetase-like amidotransferase/phosphosugar isomerase protein
MCGLWGFETVGGKPSESIIHEIIQRADERGGHSYGLYALDGKRKAHVIKGEGRVNSSYVIDLLKNCVLAVGHSRLATYGERSINNTQPLILKDFVIAHNGNIANYKEIMYAHGYIPTTDVDSEAIACLMHEKEPVIKGAYLAVDLKRFDGIKYYSNGYPLYKTNINGVNYFCSKLWETT